MSNPDNTPPLPPALRPLGSRILVRQKAFTDKVGSLFIPQGHRMGYEERATVLALGPRATLDVKPGDTIIFKRQPSAAIHPDAREGSAKEWEDLLLLDEDNVLAVIEPDA